MPMLPRLAAVWRRAPAPLTEAAALAALALPLLWPLLTAALPETDDGLFHYYRSIVLAWHLQQGDLFPRLAADLGYGYGLPVFNFYAPLFYYPAALFILLGLAPALAVNLTAALAAVLGGWGTLRLGRAWFGETAGWVAAAALPAAPYWLLDLYRRGALPELLGLALLPWGVLAFYQLAQHGSRRAWWAAAVLTALAALAHNIGAVWSVPGFAAAIGAGLFFSDSTDGRRNRAARAGAALALGLGLAAFFLVPVLAESQWIQTARLTVPRHLDIHNNFLAAGELVSLPQRFDPAQINPRVPRSLGLPQLVLAAVGAVLVWGKPAPGRLLQVAGLTDSAANPSSPPSPLSWPHEPGARARRGGVIAEASQARWLWLAVALATEASVALTLSASVPVWDALAPLKFIQFPWRWLGPASIGLALLAGFGAQASLTRMGRWQTAGFGVVVVAVLAGNLTWAFATYPSQPQPAGIEGVRQYERESGHIGLSTEGEFLPIWVTEEPKPEALAGRVGDGNLLARVDPQTLPGGIHLLSSEQRLTQTTATFLAETPGSVVFDWFYFPGWRATINGQPAAIAIDDPSGRMRVSLPAGESEVRLSFGTTPARTVGVVITLLAALVLVAGSRRLAPVPTHTAAKSAGAWAAVCAVMGLVLALWRVGWVDRGDTPWLQNRYAEGSVLGMGEALETDFGDQLALLGWDAPNGAVASGETATFALYWRALQPLSEDYSIAAHLVDEAGLLLAQADSQHPAQYPTSAWPLNRYARDEHRLSLPAGLPPGTYRLLIGVYSEATGASLEPDSAGLPRAGQLVEIGQISVERASQTPQPAALGIEQALTAQFGSIRLLGANISPPTLRPGDDLLATSFWEALEPPGADYLARYTLTDAAGAQFSFSVSPASPRYPTRQWTAGEILRGTHQLRVPPEAAAGAAALTVTVLDEAGAALGAPVLLGQVDIQPVTRSFDPPVLPAALGAVFGEAIELAGTSEAPAEVAPGTDLALVLHWHALGTVAHRYTVFVHLLDSAGSVAAQVDAAPLNGARPTTSWLVGEYLSDPYTLALPAGLAPGVYRLEVGLYRPDTGERLLLTTGTSLTIATVVVSE